MPLISTGEITHGARTGATGVGAFNVVQIEHAQAIAGGAEAAGLPVILQISENTARYHGGLEPIGLASLAVARAAGVPVAVHLDHAESADLVREAVRLGFTSVMFDASALPYADNVAATREITAYCHRHGVWVEAELGEIGGKDGAHAPGVRTDPDEAEAFVEATAVDALAVAVGSSHAMLTRDAVLDLALISRLRDVVGVPLVLHGSSGVGDSGLAAAVRAGMTKVNISTHLNKLFTRTVRTYLDTHTEAADPRRYLGPARDAVAAEVARLLDVLARPGR
ncbi:class II fructose-bisphosphate aldolase [[Kitasatospora] papulosa]|uniref:class II fructose-bisphosphate aldolase n=1 Tax=Streptomyces TaxID=1883 RepID=UPI0002C6B67C|nr:MULTISPECIES: class II fructose-bisphosphate aldolase [Streptomyces]MDF9872173.1 fructose-bisphosphate aldolase class II [Streptomyces pratensis]AGJ55190.1 tagatose 1,6-bisphosphate aldolase [Streptomyces sp. PAMC 26508]MCX4415841.1 class II fructose-bisphosphate aldolase [[Kitasatospora] papulosa]MDX3182488.1 class II fructose-bisphosphate aldolase [Streptomyces sp. ME02-7008A-1]MDX3302941.1 class II fructose-bisphosphate aldolase [Streptomyces sp. ME02-7008A]